MVDQCNRTVDYLRLSITDLCNYRCRYCMPEEGVCKRPRTDILSLEELAEIAIQDKCTATNPRSVSKKRMVELLKRIYNGR